MTAEPCRSSTDPARRSVLTPQFASGSGLAWSPDGSEVWFTAADVGANRSLRAVNTSGRVRTLARVPGTLSLYDVSRDGRVLVTQDQQSTGVIALAPGAEKENDLTWLDWSLIGDLSRDGRTVLLGDRRREAERATRSISAARTAHRPCGSGRGAPVLLARRKAGPGDRSPRHRFAARDLPDGGRRDAPAAVAGAASDRGALAARRPHPDERQRSRAAEAHVRARRGGGSAAAPAVRGIPHCSSRSPDARRVAVDRPGRAFGHRHHRRRGARTRSGDGEGRHRHRMGERRERLRAAGQNTVIPARIDRLDLATGRAEKWRDIVPADATGVTGVYGFRIAPDGRHYAYGYARTSRPPFSWSRG